MSFDLKSYAVGMGLQLVPMSQANAIGDVTCWAVKGAKPYSNNAYESVKYNFDSGMDIPIVFQDGPVHINGVNGASIEAYLLACALRIENFQKHDLVACDENAVALKGITEALAALKARRQRINQTNDELEEQEHQRQVEEEEEEERQLQG